MEGLKIVLLCVVAAVLYGIFHDMVTVHVCLEYFTVFHPPVFHTENPWLLALGWGTIASWWMGLLLGVFIALAAQAGSPPRLTWRQIVKPLIVLLLLCYLCAGLAGIWAYSTGPGIVCPLVDMVIPVADLPRDLSHNPNFMADYIAHNVSYDVSAIGALGLCAFLLRKRFKEGGWTLRAGRLNGAMATVRIIVGDVTRAKTFYHDFLGFEVADQWGSAFAILKKGGLTLWVSGPQTTATKPMPDGAQPAPGGWNRFVIEVGDLELEVDRLRKAGATFRNEIVEGPGGKQILLEDGEGNVVELFEAK